MVSLSGRTEVYRGVVVVKMMLNDQYGNQCPAKMRYYTKPYNRKQTASSQATILARSKALLTSS